MNTNTNTNTNKQFEEPTSPIPFAKNPKKAKVGDIFHIWSFWHSGKNTYEAIAQVIERPHGSIKLKILHSIQGLKKDDVIDSLFCYFGTKIWAVKKINIEKHPEYLL